MDISQAAIWQQAAGDTNRDYFDLYLKWDVILNGPGDFGPWPQCEPAIRENRPPKVAEEMRTRAVALPFTRTWYHARDMLRP